MTAQLVGRGKRCLVESRGGTYFYIILRPRICDIKIIVVFPNVIGYINIKSF